MSLQSSGWSSLPPPNIVTLPGFCLYYFVLPDINLCHISRLLAILLYVRYWFLCIPQLLSGLNHITPSLLISVNTTYLFCPYRCPVSPLLLLSSISLWEYGCVVEMTLFILAFTHCSINTCLEPSWPALLKRFHYRLFGDYHFYIHIVSVANSPNNDYINM